MTARNFVGWFLALFAVTQFPLYWIQYPDIIDFPNHLARMHVLMHYAASETLQRYYEIRGLEIETNLAMEVIVPALAAWMNVELALKVFVSLTMLAFTSGAAAVGRAATGRFSCLLLGVLLFTQNAVFQAGLLNYLFGAGLAFWLLAAWMSTGQRTAPHNLLAFSAGCILVYICHLSALGIYGIGVVAYEVFRARNQPRMLAPATWQPLVLALTQFLPVGILHILVSANSAGNYLPAPVTIYELGILKLLLLLRAPAIGLSGYEIVPIVVGIPLVIAVYFGFRERALRFSPSLRWIAGLLAIAIVLLPRSGFGSNLVDVRLLPACLILFWCGLELTDRSRLKPRTVLAFVTLAIFLISAETAYEWGRRNSEYADVRDALSRLPEGARIATVILDQGEAPLAISPHVSAWSIIDRSAFLSSFYAWPFQPFWVSFRPPYDTIAAKARTDDPKAEPPAYTTLKDLYDYVFVYGGNDSARVRYAPDAEAIFNSRSVRVLRTQ